MPIRKTEINTAGRVAANEILTRPVKVKAVAIASVQGKGYLSKYTPKTGWNTEAASWYMSEISPICTKLSDNLLLNKG